MSRLRGMVAVVTGASRNVGRGIATVLGKEGATVYVTGRSTRESGPTPISPPTILSAGTIEETAEMVTAAGGTGISVRVDHTVDAEVAALFDRVRADQGRLDLLINNAWGGYENFASFNAPFWEQPFWRFDAMVTLGVRAAFVTSHFAVPLMLPQRRGLIVNVTFWDRGKFVKPLLYDLAKNAINRLAYGMALELRPHDIAAIALSPGWVRTEHLLRKYDTDDQHAHLIPDLAGTESTQYAGRAVAALAADPAVIERSGRILTVGGVAESYGFTDVDGRSIPPYALPPESIID